MMRSIFRFGVFELDCQRVELRKAGVRVRLQEQPFRILMLLLSARGAVVTREELRRALWPEDTFVEFDHGLNAAVNKLRETLGDNAANPRFIETVPRRGYRFLAPVDVSEQPVRSAAQADVVSPPTRLPGRASGVAAIAAIAAVAVAGVAVLSRRVDPAAGDLVPKPLTSYPGRELHPSFSPDGDRVAFTWAENERDFDIYIKQIGSEQPQRVTTNPSDDVQPVWSPDGLSIAFLRRTTGSTAAIVLIPAFGGPERRIGELQTTRSDAIGRRLLMWLPDSRHLIVSDNSLPQSPRALFRVSAFTGQRQQITFPPQNSFGDEAPDLSPDFRMLAFARERNSVTSELFVLRLSEDFKPSGEPKRITNLGQVSSDPVWSADGSEIIFVSGPQHGRRFLRMQPSASAQPQPVFPVSGTCRGGVAASQTKNRLVYSRSTWDVNIWRLDLLSSAPQLQAFVQSTSLDHLPAFSADGSRVAFVTNRSGAQELWVCRSDGTDSRILVSVDGEVGLADWSPDGRLIAFEAARDGFKHIFTVAPNGGPLTQITSGPSNNEAPSWSHDGKWLYFASDRKKTFQIWKTSTVDAAAQPVLVTQEGLRAFESPDGKYLFYLSGVELSSLYRMSTDGGEERLVFEPVSNVGNFTVSRTGVYFISPEDVNGKARIQFLRFGSSDPTTIALSDKPVGWGMAVSPDEHSLLFTQFDRSENDLMLIENVR